MSVMQWKECRAKARSTFDARLGPSSNLHLKPDFSFSIKLEFEISNHFSTVFVLYNVHALPYLVLPKSKLPSTLL